MDVVIFTALCIKETNVGKLDNYNRIKGSKHIFWLTPRLTKFQGRKYESYFKILTPFFKNFFFHEEMGYVNFPDSFCWSGDNIRAGTQRTEDRYAHS